MKLSEEYKCIQHHDRSAAARAHKAAHSGCDPVPFHQHTMVDGYSYINNYACVCLCACVLVQMCVYSYVCTNVHIYVCVYIYIYIYIYVRVKSLPPVLYGK